MEKSRKRSISVEKFGNRVQELIMNSRRYEILHRDDRPKHELHVLLLQMIHPMVVIHISDGDGGVADVLL